MSANTSTHATVAILDGTNYELWASQMTSLLQAKGLFKFITPRAALLKNKFKDDIEKLEPILEGDERALGYIKSYMLQGFVDLIRSDTTAMKAWTTLERHFAGKETFNKIHLLEQLIDGRLEESENPMSDVQDFIKKKNELVRRLHSAGLEIKEDLQIAIMLARLPESFETMRRIMESKADLSLTYLTAELNREAIRQTNSRKRPIAEKSFLGDADDADVRPSAAKKQRTERKNLKCSYCDGKGHEQSRCWLNPKSKAYRPDFKERLLKSLTEEKM